jgi:hypothetical protein
LATTGRDIRDWSADQLFALALGVLQKQMLMGEEGQKAIDQFRGHILSIAMPGEEYQRRRELNVADPPFGLPAI